MGKITAIEPQKRARGRINIYVEGEFVAGLDEKLLIDFDLYKGKELTLKDLKELAAADSLSKCLAKAYRFLSFRMRSEKEMRDKLAEKFEENIAEAAIQKLKKFNYLNDTEFANTWIRERSIGRGKKALRFELIRKGIEKDLIDDQINQIQEDDEHQNALALVQRKSKYKNIEQKEAYNKIGGFLARRGYGYEIIKKVINDIYG